MSKTKIEWCDYTVNLWWGCREVSEACKNCYAKNIAKRFKKECWGDNPRIDMRKQAYEKIARIAKKARKLGVRYKVFINSMSDFFEKDVVIGDVIYLADALRYPFYMETKKYEDCLDFLLLTKRPQRLLPFETLFLENSKNIHLGITAENQARLDERMEALKDFKAKVFLSCEPLLEPINIEKNCYPMQIDWIITGGETGHNARFCDRRWIQSLVNQADYHDIPFFFKKWGSNSNGCCTPIGWRQFPTWRKASND